VFKLPLLLLLPFTLHAQVNYEGARPWSIKANEGPDAEVDGWFYNLGITGLRAKLSQEQPEDLVIRHVFKRTPAAKAKLKEGDSIVGINGKQLEIPHLNGYGEEVFGAQGPISTFAEALDHSLKNKKPLKLTVLKAKSQKEEEVSLKFPSSAKAFANDFPLDCPKSEELVIELLDHLKDHQNKNGSFGRVPRDTFAPLAMMSSGLSKYRKSIEKNVKYHAETTSTKDRGSLINWRYMAAGIVLSEYYLATEKKWVLKELQEIYDFLSWSQYTDISQLHPKSKETHPDALPQPNKTALGGWGHNPGFEGYGPICMTTAQGAICFALMHRCGIKVDRERLDSAYDFLHRGASKNGYIWYSDKVAKENSYADMGRTAASAIAYALSPYPEPHYQERAQRYSQVMGTYPKTFPDTHGSPIMGMGYGAAGAMFSAETYQKIMKANRFWFITAECADGTYYYQPNRDNAGYGNDSRLSASAATAFILMAPKKALHITGKQPTTDVIGVPSP